MAFKLHYNTTSNDSDKVSISDNRGNLQSGATNFAADMVSMNVGWRFLYGSTTMTVAYGNPFPEDRCAEGEMRGLLIRLF